MTERYTVRLTRRALEDIDRIHDYIAKDSMANAAAMVGRLFDAIDLLEIVPNRTIVELEDPALAHPVRTLPVPPFVIYFRVIEAERVVVIRHIRHGARRRPRGI